MDERTKQLLDSIMKEQKERQLLDSMMEEQKTREEWLSRIPQPSPLRGPQNLCLAKHDTTVYDHSLHLSRTENTYNDHSRYSHVTSTSVSVTMKNEFRSVFHKCNIHNCTIIINQGGKK